MTIKLLLIRKQILHFLRGVVWTLYIPYDTVTGSDYTCICEIEEKCHTCKIYKLSFHWYNFDLPRSFHRQYFLL